VVVLGNIKRLPVGGAWNGKAAVAGFVHLALFEGGIGILSRAMLVAQTEQGRDRVKHEPRR
jgi:hypothetical protein